MRKNIFLFRLVFILSLLGPFFFAEPLWAIEPQISAGYSHTVALKSNGTLWAWGRNDYGELGDGTTTGRRTPVQVSGGGNDWVAIAAGGAHTVALKSDGTLWAWGYNGHGQLGDGTTTDSHTPVQVPGAGNTWATIAAGGTHTVALKSDGTLWAWGLNDHAQLGVGGTVDAHTPVQVSGGNTWVAIAAGDHHTLALKSNGTLWTWGWNIYGQIGAGNINERQIPDQVSGGGNNWVAIGAGAWNTVALRSDGTLWAWGHNNYGQIGDGTITNRYTPVQVSGGGNNWVAIAAEEEHTLALKSDGTLWAWGHNNYGQLGDGTITDRWTPVQVFGGRNNWVAIAAGGVYTIGGFSVALKSDGTLWAWGINQYGQLGDGRTTERHTPVQISGAGNTWVSIAAGNAHTVALKSDGTLWPWGHNNYGQVGDGSTTDRWTPVQVSGGGNTWVAIAAGGSHTVALKSDGTLWAWGWNGAGQLGDGTTTDSWTPVEVSGGGNTWVAISAGFGHTVALKSDGTLWAWGWNAYGQLGDGSTLSRTAPVQVSGGENTWVAIAAGALHTIALKSDGALWAWGLNNYGQLGVGTTTGWWTPVQVSGGGGTWVAIAAGYYHTVALKSDGTMWAWGRNDNGQVGDWGTTQRNAPVQVSGGGNTWATIAAGGSHTTALKSDGTLWAWGDNFYGQLGDNSTTDKHSPVQIGSDNKWVKIAAGNAHTLALKSDGTLWAWGQNGFGQVGDGTTTDRHSPVQVVQIGSDNKWVFIAAGYSHTLALKSDGTLWAWGENDHGQLGDNSTTNRRSPVQIGSDNKWVSISAGVRYSLGLKSDGTLWAWGWNNYGQLGDNSTTDRHSPVQIADNRWVSIAAGLYYCSLGLKSDGTLWAWGYNGPGYLGDGTTTDRHSPVQIGSDNRWISIAAGGGHSLGLKSDGALWAWGRNYYGQVGDGSTTDRNMPTQVAGGGNTWMTIAAGAHHTLGLKSDGTLWAWGSDSDGQLGDNSTTDRHSPAKIGLDNTWISISAGWAHSLGLKSDGTLWAWGDNFYGQLGDNSTTDRHSPVRIGSENNWVSIAAGSDHSLGLKLDGTLWAWGNNNYGQLGDGTTIDRHSPVRAGIRKLLVDFDGDSYSDLAGINSAGNIFYTTDLVTWTNIPGVLTQLVVGDFDGDSQSDLAGINSNGHVFYTTDLTTWINIPGVLTQLVVGDFNGDGKSDLAGINSAGNIFYTTDLSTWINIPGVLTQLVVGDFNKDGESELAGINSNGHIFYTTNLTTWTNIPGVLTQIVTGDFNGDGQSDLAGINSVGHIFYTTNLSTWTNIPGVFTQLVVGNFNGDGQSDLAGINSAGNIFYTTNLSTWTNIPGVLTQLVVGDFDGDGLSDLAGINSVGNIFYTTDLQTWTNIPGVLVDLAE